MAMALPEKDSKVNERGNEWDVERPNAAIGVRRDLIGN
jgi:hypothetical protein